MVVYCICVLAGAYATEAFSELPGQVALTMLGGFALSGFVLRPLRPISCGLTGFVVMSFSGASQVQDKLDQALEGQTVSFAARIEDFVKPGSTTIGFLVLPVGRPDLPTRIRLNWLAPERTPQIGETWRLQTRLRRPRGFSNPGGFDFESWLFRQEIGATGYVLAGPGTYRVHGERVPLLPRIRRNIVQRVERLLPPDHARAVLLAIGVGARHQISREQWDLYARTGTSHLMAISGLHIGLASASMFVATWSLLGLVAGRRNIVDIAVVTSVSAAIAYAALSGFAVPARRASLMAATAGVMLLLRRRIAPGVLVSGPCIFIFLSTPLSVLSPGFKLSFAAVVILLFVAGRHFRPLSGVTWLPARRPVRWLRQLFCVQLALLAGLFPLTALIFDRFAMIAPAVNLLVLPVFNFVTVPLTLLGMVLDGPLAGVGDLLLTLAHTSVRRVLSMVTAAGAANLASFELAGTLVAWALLPVVHVLLPVGWPGRKVAFVAIVAVTLHRPPTPSPGCFQYFVLDVGQGLATVIRTRTSTVLFDTGPAFQGGSAAAELVVLPFLSHAGIERIDRLVVSHSDLDHSGGVAPIVAGVETGQVLTGEFISYLGRAQRPCSDNVSWHVDGVHFRILHPRDGAPWRGNNASCVLEVSAGERRLLLTGDIEAPVEILLAHRKKFSASNVVVVPHHGSRTSSRMALVEATRPETAIVAAGYGNRWGFPKEDVLDRWKSVGANVENTATSGAISQQICADDGVGPIARERHRTLRYWQDGFREGA